MRIYFITNTNVINWKIGSFGLILRVLKLFTKIEADRDK